MAQLRVSASTYLADGAVRGARRIRIRRWAIAISTTALVAGSVAGAVALLGSPTTPLAPTAATPASADQQGGGYASRIDRAAATSPEAAIYIAALQSRPTPEVGMDESVIYVESVRCRGDEPGMEPCDLQPIPLALQQEVSAALPYIRFVTREEAVQLRGVVLIRLGQITYSDGAAMRAYLPIGVHCGMLCGEGATFVLARQADDTWKVVGTTGISWIS